MVSNCWTQTRSNPTKAIKPLLNSVEIQAHVPAITAMTIKVKAIEPRSSPTLSLPHHGLYLFFDSANPAYQLVLRASKISHRDFNPRWAGKNKPDVIRLFGFQMGRWRRRIGKVPMVAACDCRSTGHRLHPIRVIATRWLAMTWIQFRILATCFARGLHLVSPQRNQRAQGRPGASRTRGPACRLRNLQKMHTSIQVQAEHPGLPCAMALRLASCSPRRTALLPPSPGRDLRLSRA